MKISVKVKTGAKENKVAKVGDKSFVISVKEKPKEERANKAVIKLLADYFDVPASQIKIVSGKTSKNKIIEIYDPRGI